MQAGAITQAAGAIAAKSQQIGQVTVVSDVAPAGTNGKQLRSLAADVRNRLGEKAAVVMLFAQDNDKIPFVAALNPAAINLGFKAGELVQKIGPMVGGRGGGKPDMAQGAGNNAAGVTQAMEELHQIIRDAQ